MKFRFPAVLLLAAIALVLPAPARAAACSGTSGVTVVVQFPDGHTEIGCAPGDPATGVAALQDAGFTVKPVFNSGFVCRINNSPSSDPCDHTPPANAYWAYFHAKRGGSWSYSTTGGGGYNPKPGTVEGWRFGSGSEPSTSPPGSTGTPTPKPTPKPTTRPTAHPTSGASNPVVKPEGTTEPSPGSTSTPTAPDASSPSGTATPAPGATATATDDAAVAGTRSTERPTADPKDDGSSAGRSWIWGVALVGVLGAAAVTTAARRRRS